MEFTIQRHDQENLVVLELEGELDVSSSPALREELTQLIDGGARRIALDMTRVAYMDSSGLAALVTAHRALGARGDLALVGCRPTVERVLRFTQFDRVVPVFRTFEDFAEGNRDNLRAVSGVSKTVMQKQKQISKVVPKKGQEQVISGRRLS